MHATIRRCAGLSAAKRRRGARLRRVRWGASRRNGSRHPRTSLLLPTCLASGSTDLVHGRRPPHGIVLDMDSSVSPTHGEQEPGPATIAPSCFLCPSKTHGAPAHGVIPPDRHLDLVGIDPKAVNDNDEGSPAYILSMLANIKQQRPALPF